MAYDAFISYSAADAQFAVRVCDYLEVAGLRCWLASRDVRPGEVFAAEIVRAIHDAGSLVFICGSHSNDSPHQLRELAIAVDARKHLLALRLDTLALSPELQYYLAPNHWLTASPGDDLGFLAAVRNALCNLIRFAPVSALSPAPESRSQRPHPTDTEIESEMARIDSEIEANKPAPRLEDAAISSALLRLRSESLALQLAIVAREKAFSPPASAQVWPQRAIVRLSELIERADWYLDLNG